MHATHVLIRGHIFTYAEKAPFMPSGESVLGALEYDEATDSTKCHECGEWSPGLGGHIKIHGMQRVDYNQRHGLRLTSSISGMKRKQQCRELEQMRMAKGGGITAPEVKRKRDARGSNAGKPHSPKTVEWRNEHARCKAQILFRLQTLAAEVGHTPTQPERRASLIQSSTMIDMFGSVENALRAAGLDPNGRDDGPVPKPLPRNFPSKEELAAKKAMWEMPWDSYAKSRKFGSPDDAIPRSNTPLSQF